jgi:hypothetical protein
VFKKLRSLLGSSSRVTNENNEAVLVHLDGTGLPGEVYETCDTSTLEDRLTEIVVKQGLGEFDGNESGPTETILFMYGPDAKKLFTAIEPTLRDYPLSRNARVVIRKGGPGAPQREVRL